LESLTKISVAEWLRHARQRLDPISEFASIEAQALLCHVLQQPRVWLITHPAAELSDDQAARLDNLLERLANGEPLPYLTGKQEFFGLTFQVSPSVLIPRPETELLVELALAYLQDHRGRRCADVGTGSGCIGVTLIRYVPNLRVVAADVSMEALLVARENARFHRVENRIFPVQTDLLTALAGPFDLVCANLPYIPARTLAGLPVTRYEPLQALDGGPDGLRWISRLLQDAERWLAPGGMLLLEIEAGQGESVPALASQALPGAQVKLHHDYAGLPRLVSVERGG